MLVKVGHSLWHIKANWWANWWVISTLATTGLLSWLQSKSLFCACLSVYTHAVTVGHKAEQLINLWFEKQNMPNSVSWSFSIKPLGWELTATCDWHRKEAMYYM